MCNVERVAVLEPARAATAHGRTDASERDRRQADVELLAACKELRDIEPSRVGVEVVMRSISSSVRFARPVSWLGQMGGVHAAAIIESDEALRASEILREDGGAHRVARGVTVGAAGPRATGSGARAAISGVPFVYDVARCSTARTLLSKSRRLPSACCGFIAATRGGNLLGSTVSQEVECREND